jgi:peptidoglycan/xylan/chitin deacetylase (PgdA/CDA1 family)
MGKQFFRAKMPYVLSAFLLALPLNAPEVITHFKTEKKLVAITFDACPTGRSSSFDVDLLDFLVKNKIPSTFFLSGSFIRNNVERIRELSTLDFIEMENHSFRHIHFQGVDKAALKENVLKNDALIRKLTDRKPLFFRFPYGEYDQDSLEEVESLGYKVVQWSFESGDPDEGVTRDELIREVVSRTKPGSIIIFHINGRGWHTKEAIGPIVEKLREKGYDFVLLRDVIGEAGQPSTEPDQKRVRASDAECSETAHTAPVTR